MSIKEYFKMPLTKWTLSHKVITIIVIQIALLLALQVAVQWRIILPAFRQIEVEQASNAMNRIKEEFLSDLDYMDRFIYEYSDWEDSYEFIRSKDQDYITDNLYEGIALHLGANVMIYTTQDLDLVWGVEETEAFDQIHRSRNRDLLHSIIDQLQDDVFGINPKDELDDQFAKGFALINQVPAMYAVRPIFSTRYADQNGYVILVKYIDEQLVSLYEERLSNRFAISPIDSSELNASKELLGIQLATISSTRLAVTDVMQTGNTPIFLITAELFRDITLTGLNSIYLASIILLIVGIVSVAFIWIYISSHFFKPLEALSSQMQDISLSGDYSKQYQIDREDEVGTLAKSFNVMISNINSHQSRLEQTQVLLREANDQLSVLVMRDSLTGIANRLAFKENLEAKWKAFARLKLPLTIMMIDIDYFKDYNDLYGHLQGDECLKQVAQILSSCFKRSNDFLARYGGEEFIGSLAGSPEVEVHKVAKAILEKLRNENIVHEGSKVASHITVSIGIATVTPDAQMNYEDLIAKADQALYQAKEAGRNQVVVHS